MENPVLAKLVVDSSIVIKWFTPEPNSSRARLILAQYQTGLLTLIAPDVILYEIANIVWRKHMTQRLAAADGQAILDLVRTLGLRLSPAADLMDSAYALSVRLRCSVYDMLYLALALRERCTYITADEDLVNSVNPAFPNVTGLSSFK
jgi:predicted nucleic acid-binding protein